MAAPAPKRIMLVVLLAIVAAVIVGILWFNGRGGQSAAPSPAPTPAATTNNTPPPAAPAATTPAPAAPSSVGNVASKEKFAVLSCQARLFDNAPALAVTFSQPIDTRQSLDKVMRVTELGEAKADAPSRGLPQPGPATGGTARNGNWVVGDNPRVAYFPFATPQRRYAVTIDAGLKPREGEALDAIANCEMASEAMPASFYFASKGVVLPAAQNGGLPIVTVNVPEVDVQFLRIDEAHMPEFFEKVLGVKPPGKASESEEESDSDEYEYGYEYGSSGKALQGSASTWALDRLKDMSTSVHIGRYQTEQTPNRRRVSFLPVEKLEALQQPGIYIAVMNQPGRFREEYQVSYFYVTDIGLHARRYNGRIDAFASSLKTGKAISGLEMRVLDENAKPIAKATADSLGHATFTGALDNARLLLTQRGKEISVIALNNPALDLSEFDIGGLPARNNRLFVYAGRDLYRPGERIDVSVLVRGPDGEPLPPSPLSATLKRPDGRTVSTSTWPAGVDPAGYLRQTLAVPADGQTGTWTLELRVDPGSRQADASWTFQVEEFLPERMKLTLDAGPPVVQLGEDIDVTVQGDYLYGAPAAGNRLLGTRLIVRKPVALPQQWPGFIFGDVADDTSKQIADLPEMELDEQGAAEFTMPVELENVHSPMRVKASLSLLESGGRPVVRSIERDVWPAPALIGVRPQFSGNVTGEGSLAQFEFIRVDTEGKVKPLPEAKLRLYREERQYYWRYDDNRGWHGGYTETEELTETATLNLTERARIGLPVRWGRYRLEVTDPEHGQTMRYRFYAGWDAQDAEAMGNRPDRVQLKVEQTPLKQGEPVKLTITPPHDGEALITVEGQGLLWTGRESVKATGTQIEIPFGKDWNRHDLYVSVAVFRPGSQGNGVTPARAIGLLHLPLDRAERGLKVKLEAPAKIRPERKQTVGVQVEGVPAGTKAHVTLSAVDVGILGITQYKTPDPFNFFFGKQRYAPDMLDLYGKLIEKMDGTMLQPKWGGDTDKADSRNMPAKVKLVDLFSGVVELDAQGRAQIPLDIPDFNGTLRLMAVAFTENRFGNAEAEMVVAAPIVAELSTPRFISPGDRAMVALDLTNMSGAAQNVTVALEGEAPIRIVDGARSVRLTDKQRNTVRFEVEATGPVGLGVLRLKVTGRGGPEPIDILRTSALQVQPVWPAVRAGYRVRVAPGATWQPDPAWINGLYPDGASVSISMSNQPPFNISRLVQGLLDYPYGCTEQTLSAAYPFVLIEPDQAKAWGLPPQTREVRAQRVAAAVARLAGTQKSTGGFTLWGDGAPDAWLSSYVLGFLQDARQQGFSVPESMGKQTQTWLLSQLQSAASYFPTLPKMTRGPNGTYASRDLELLRNSHRRFADLAFASYVLARDNQAPLSTLRVLADRYSDRAMSPLPLVHLSLALRAMGDAARADKMLDEAMKRPYGSEGNEWLGDYGSTVRDLSMTYALLAEAKVEHPRRELLLNDIAQRLAGRRYLSTQEQISVFRAARAMGAGGGEWQARWDQGGRSETLTSRTTEMRSVSAEMINQAGLTNLSDKAMYIEADVQGFPVQPDTTQSEGLAINRTWFYKDGRRWDGGALKTGDTMVVRLETNSRRRIEDALVVDRVPAGMEVENMNLLVASGGQDWTIDGKVVASVMADGAIRHTEYRDDRFVAAIRANGKNTLFYTVRVVTPGRYRVPAPVIEDMYRPEIRASGAVSADVVVTDPRAARTR